MSLYSEVECIGLGQFSIYLAIFRRKKNLAFVLVKKLLDSGTQPLALSCGYHVQVSTEEVHLQTINVMELCTIVCISMHTCLLGTLDPKKDAVIVWETTLHKLAKDIKALRVL